MIACREAQIQRILDVIDAMEDGTFIPGIDHRANLYRFNDNQVGIVFGMAVVMVDSIKGGIPRKWTAYMRDVFLHAYDDFATMEPTIGRN